MQHFDVTEGSFDGAEIFVNCGFIPPKPVERFYYKWMCWCLQRQWSCRCAGIFWSSIGQIKKKYRFFQITWFSDHNWNKFENYWFFRYLDLENDKFYPYRKPNNTPLYVHSESNHRLNILKQLPKMTSEQLSNLSFNKDKFIKASGEYQNVLKPSGFKGKLIYTPCSQRNRR